MIVLEGESIVVHCIVMEVLLREVPICRVSFCYYHGEASLLLREGPLESVLIESVLIMEVLIDRNRGYDL